MIVRLKKVYLSPILVKVISRLLEVVFTDNMDNVSLNAQLHNQSFYFANRQALIEQSSAILNIQKPI